MNTFCFFPRTNLNYNHDSYYRVVQTTAYSTTTKWLKSATTVAHNHILNLVFHSSSEPNWIINIRPLYIWQRKCVYINTKQTCE